MDDFTVRMILEWMYKNKELLAAAAEAKGMQKTVKSLRADIKQGFTQALAQVDKFATGLVRAGKRALLLGGIVVAAFAGAVIKISDAGAKLEGYQVTLQQLYGDARQAGEAMDWIMGLQVKTPYTPDELLGGLKQMKVFGLDAQKWLPAVGDMASTMGMDLVESSRAVSKAYTAGAAGADMLRESFGATMEKLAQVSGYTTKELQGDINKYREALWAFVTDPKFAGGMKRYAATFKGVLSSVKGGIQTFVMYVGREINNVMKADFQKVVDWIVKAYESGKLEEWAKRVAEGFKMIWQGVKKAGELVWKFVKPVVNFFKEHPSMLKWAIAAVAAGGAFSLLGGGISVLTGKIWQLGRGLVGGIGKLRQFGSTLKGLFSNVRAAGGISGLLAGKGGFLGGLGQMAGGLGGKLSGMGGVAGKLGGLLGGGGAAGAGGLAASLSAALPIIGAVIAAVALFATAWKKNFSGIRETTKKAFEPLADVGRNLAGLPKNAGSPMKAIGSIFKETWQGMARVAAPVFAFLVKSITAPFKFFKAIAIPIIEAVKKLLRALGIIGKDAGSGIKGIFEGIASVVGWVMDKFGKLVDFIADSAAWLIDLVIEPLSKIVDWVVSLVGKGREKIGGAFEKIGEVARFVVGLLKLIWEKLFVKLKRWWDGTVATAAEALYAIIDFFKGLWNGIKKGATDVWNWIKKNLFEPIGKAIGDIGKFFAGIWEKIKKPILDAWNWMNERLFKPIGNFFANLFKPVKDAFDTVVRWLADLISKAPGWLMDTLGISEEEIKQLREWSSVSRSAAGVQLGNTSDALGGKEITPTSKDERAAADAAAAAAGAGSGGGGPTINNYITHNHVAPGAINVISNDAEKIKRILLQIFDAEGLSVTTG